MMTSRMTKVTNDNGDVTADNDDDVDYDDGDVILTVVTIITAIAF